MRKRGRRGKVTGKLRFKGGRDEKRKGVKRRKERNRGGKMRSEERGEEKKEK